MLLKKKIECLVCFKNTQDQLCFYNLLSNKDLCCYCFNQIQSNHKIIYYKQHNIYILYQYNKVLRNVIKQWKINKCLKSQSIIASLIKKHLSKTKTYIYPPSILKKDQKSNIELLLNQLHIKSKNIFQKTQQYEQKDIQANLRKSNFHLVKKVPVNFYLIDDIYTSGKTIKKALDLLEKKGYAKLKVLIIASNYKK